MHARPLETTDLSIGRIVKHLAFTEDRWFQHKLLGRELPEPWRSVDPSEAHSWSFHSADGTSIDAIVDLYLAACDRSRTAVELCPTMETLAASTSFNVKPVNLRWLLAHMIDETLRELGSGQPLAAAPRRVKSCRQQVVVSAARQ